MLIFHFHIVYIQVGKNEQKRKLTNQTSKIDKHYEDSKTRLWIQIYGVRQSLTGKTLNLDIDDKEGLAMWRSLKSAFQNTPENTQDPEAALAL